jgi:Protein of unknown function (DUF2924)
MNAKLELVQRAALGSVDLDRLARMPPKELQRLHRRILGCDVPSGNCEQTRRKIAWRLQEDKEGGLPESARQHALAIARQSGLRIRARVTTGDGAPVEHATVTGLVSDHDARIPMPGSVIVKDYRGRAIVVHVLDDGFECDGRRFASLSAIAKETTGTKWNGFLFFGLVKRRARGR